MQNLYEIQERNLIKSKNQTIKKVDFLFELEKDLYCIHDIESIKKIKCVSGSCDLTLEREGLVETVTLDNPSMTVRIDKNIFVEISNYDKQTKITIEYIESESEVFSEIGLKKKDFFRELI